MQGYIGKVLITDSVVTGTGNEGLRLVDACMYACSAGISKPYVCVCVSVCVHVRACVYAGLRSSNDRLSWRLPHLVVLGAFGAVTKLESAADITPPTHTLTSWCWAQGSVKLAKLLITEVEIVCDKIH